MTTFIEAIQGGVFEFQIGPDKKSYLIHRKVVENISPVLNKMIKNDMKEGLEGTAWLTGVDTQTFSAFCRYAYAILESFLQDSTVHEVCVRCKKMVLEASVLFLTSIPCQYCQNCFKKESMELAKFTKLREHLFNVYDLNRDNRKKYFNAYHASFKLYRYSPDTLMTHAQLFIFADMYLIEPLKAVSLSYLYYTLKSLKLSEPCIVKINELVSFVYKETECLVAKPSSVTGQGESPINTYIPRVDLKLLILVLLRARSKELLGFKAFREFMAIGGSFVADFLEGVSLEWK